jgi:hypothetical protein
MLGKSIVGRSAWTRPERDVLRNSWTPVRATVPPKTWAAELAVGRALSRQEALAVLRTPSLGDDPAG